MSTQRPAPTPFIGHVRVPWLRPLAQVLRTLALLVGAVAASIDGFDRLDLGVVLVLGTWIVWRALSRQLGSDVRLRATVGLEIALTTTAVVLTGGWTSPWLLVQVVPLGLAVLGLPLARSALLTLLVVAATTVTVLVEWPGLGVLLEGPTTLVVAAAFAAVTRAALIASAPERDDALGTLEDLWSVNAMLEGLHASVRVSGARFDLAEAFDTLRASSPQLAAADLLALLVLQDDGRLRPLHAVGLPGGEVRARDLPARTGGPRRDGVPVALALPGGGLLPRARTGAYVWLPVDEGEPPHVLVVEYEGGAPHPDDLTPELLRLAQPLAVTVANAAWFGRVRHLGVDEERQRIAARLHDSFAQSLASVALDLELAARRHPDDTHLAGLVERVRESLAGLRDTMVELRASVDEERDLPGVLRQLVDRLRERHGLLAELTCEVTGVRPPRVVEQQLLRITQELVRRAAEERGATAVYVHYAVTPGQVRLEVRDDGEAPERSGDDVADVIGERAEAVAGRVERGADAAGLALVGVVVERDPRPGT